MIFNQLSIKQKKACFVAFVFLLYGCRLLFMYSGYLKNYSWLDNGDESHIYMLGLKFFTDGAYPYWGPDVVYSSSYLVGGLQGLLVGIPLFIWVHPFSPYLFLFVMLSTSMIYLSWYISKLFPQLPKLLIYWIIGLTPFTIHTGLKVLNPAYVLCVSIPFMLSIGEIFKLFPIQYISFRWRYFWLGLGVMTVFQLHASWIFLAVLLFVAMVYTFLNRNTLHVLQAYLFCIIGGLIGGMSLFPTLYHFGIGSLFQHGKSLGFDVQNIFDVGAIIYYFITLCGFEMNSFSTNYRASPLWAQGYTMGACVFVILQVVGILLVVFQVIFPLWAKWRAYVLKFKRMLVFNMVIVALLSSMYLLSSVRPGSHAIICIYPLSAIYLCWFIQGLVSTTRVGYTPFCTLIGLLILYYITVVQVTDNLPDLGYRQKAFEAIEQKDASIFETPRYPYPALKR